MISLYRPGTSLIHRLPAGWKLLGLMALLIAGPIFTVPGFLLCFFMAGFGIRELGRQVWQVKLLLLLVLIPQVIFAGLERGSYNTLGVMAGVLLAALVSMTTKTTDIVELIQRITKSRSFALLIALSINSIALVLGFSKSISETGLARGVKPNPIRQIVTLFVVSLRFADDYAEALAARGVSV